jgi:hypothetical protein
VERLAVALAGGSPASAASAGYGLGNPWPRPHREAIANLEAVCVLKEIEDEARAAVPPENRKW